jgi:hypothetical protein
MKDTDSNSIGPCPEVHTYFLHFANDSTCLEVLLAEALWVVMAWFQDQSKPQQSSNSNFCSHVDSLQRRKRLRRSFFASNSRGSGSLWRPIDGTGEDYCKTSISYAPIEADADIAPPCTDVIAASRAIIPFVEATQRVPAQDCILLESDVKRCVPIARCFRMFGLLLQRRHANGDYIHKTWARTAVSNQKERGHENSQFVMNPPAAIFVMEP